MFEWIAPRFDVAGACLALLILVTCAVAAVRGSTAKARAARDRLVAAPGGRIVLYRAGIRTSVMLAVAAFAVVWTDGVDLVDLGLRAPVAGDAVVAGFVAAVFVPAVLIGNVRVARARRDGRSIRGARGAEATLARVRFMYPATATERWLAGGLAVAVGVGEELVYRGLFIAAGVGLLGLDAWAAALLSLAVFGADHLYQGWRGALSATLLGFVFTLLYATTEAILAPIAVHAAFDVAALVIAPWLAQIVERRPARTPGPDLAAQPTAEAAPTTAATATTTTATTTTATTTTATTTTATTTVTSTAGTSTAPIALRRAAPE